MLQKRIVVRSFRIFKEWNEVLEEEAEKQEISVNALLNKILQEYSIFHRHAKNYGTITLSHIAFAKILECCSGKEIEAFAEETGSANTKDGMLMMGLPFTKDNLLSLIAEFGKIGGMFKVDHIKDGGNETFHLRHDLGRNWSVYLAGSVSGMFKTVLNKEVKSEIFDNYVAIEFNT